MSILFVFLLLGAGEAVAQTYLPGQRTVSYFDAARGRTVTAEIFYPANSAGVNVPLASGTEIFPVVSFGHGFTIGASSYYWLGDSLARRGYIVLLASTETGISPSHANFAADLEFLANHVIGLNTDALSFLFGRVLAKAAVGGHSMGGGCSVLAASGNKPNLYALFNFAAAETNPSSTNAALNVQRPTLLFSGSNDCIVSPSVQQGMYNNIPAAVSKTWVTVDAGTHCQPSNNNFNCVFGQISSGCNSSSITISQLFQKSLALLAPFLDYYLKDQCSSGTQFLNAYQTTTGITGQQSFIENPACVTVAISSLSLNAKFEEEKVLLNWQSSNDGTGYFDITRSSNAKQWISLGLVEKTAGYRPYYFTDPYPGQLNFYRIKQVLHTGAVLYSPIVKMSRVKVPEVYIQGGQIFIQNSTSCKLNKLQVLDAQGQLLLSAKISTGMQVDVSGLGKKILFVKLFCADHIHVYSLLN